MVSFFLIFLEICSYYLLKKNDPNNLKFNTHPLIQLENGRPRLRKDAFRSDFKKFWVGSEKNQYRDEKNILGVASFFKKEGLISSKFGDFFINKWGFRGPFFEKEKPDNIFRIAALGASTTLGWWVGNELTYPRILERMLNNKLNKKKNFQVINTGQYYHQSCDVKRIYKNDVLKFNPDMLLIMSGWNDINQFRDPRFDTHEKYCLTPSFLDFSYTFKFLKFIKNKNLKKNLSKNFENSIIERNFKFYQKNLEEIIVHAEGKNIDIGLVSIPTIIQKNISFERLKKFSELKDFDEQELKYHQQAGLRINSLYEHLEKKYKNVFYITSGLSFNSRGKQMFFSDPIHQTESGNRIQAFAVYQNLVKKLNIHEEQKILFPQKEIISHNLLELGYVKGIFQANQIEDLSYSGCIAFHGKCDVESNNDNFDFQVNGILEFVLGSWLQFRSDVRVTNNRLTLNKLLSKVMEMKPNYSLAYWVSGILNKEWQENTKSNENFRKAFSLNPLLKNVDFEKEYRSFQDRTTPNPFLVKLNDLIFILKKAPKNVSAYTFFWWLSHNPDANIKKQLEMTSFLYYSSPLMAKSIFENLIKTLIENKIHRDVILEFLKKIKKMKPEYNFNEYFSTFDKELKLES